MMVIVSYDISLKDKKGQERLRKISKECLNHGQRVQNSVYECSIDYGKFLTFRDKLLKLMDKDLDSIRFYLLGNNWHGKIEHHGVKTVNDPDGLLLI